jgi:type I restriction enzyme S subunit
MFEDCLVKAAKAKQVQASEYNAGSKYPIVSQEDKMVSGYCDDSSFLYHIDKPVVIFGDHTRVLKYVDFDFVVGADGVKILIPKDFLKAKFLLYYLRWYKVPSLGYSRHYKLLKEINLPIPPLSEQQRIVSELDLLSGIIEKKKAQLKEYDQLVQSIFYDMFGDPMTNEKGWEVKKLGEVASFKNGLNYHPKDDGFQIKCIGVGDFQNKKEIRDFSSINDYSIDEDVDDSYYLKDGDIIIVRSNGSKDLVGRNMIVYPNCQKVTYSGFCIRCRLNSSTILPIILNRILSDRGTMMVLRQEGRGCNISNINQKILSSLPIILPPLSLQQSFAEKIEAIEQQKALIQQSIAETETLFNSRMDYYFN